MQGLLVQRELWSVVSGKIVRHPTDTKEQTVFDSKDEKALAYIWAGVTDKFLHQISSCKTSKEAWDLLKNMYERSNIGRKLYLKNRLQILRIEETENISTYLNAVTELQQQLAGVEIEVDEDEIVLKILNSLTEKFKMIVTSLNTEGFTKP